MTPVPATPYRTDERACIGSRGRVCVRERLDELVEALRREPVDPGRRPPEMRDKDDRRHTVRRRARER